MDKRIWAYARYWRNSLADASLGQGAFSIKDVDLFLELKPEVFGQGKLPEPLVEKLFKGVGEDTSVISVVFRPHVFNYRVERGTKKYDGSPSIITPLICFAKLSRSGKLYPFSTPVVPRDILEPLEAKTYSIGSVDDLDHFLSKELFVELPYDESETVDDDSGNQENHSEYWTNYKAYCERLVDAVAADWLSHQNYYVKAGSGFILSTENVKGASQHVLALYDYLRRTKPAVPLFETFACDTAIPHKQTFKANNLVAERLAHASDQYALATAQRDALTHILAIDNGEILAVNGPPGTGKTTLVLSLVATLWSKAAIDGDPPPVIMASSANNQATSNVINAFGKDFSEGSGPLAGRWLPDVHSYGAYFPSRTEEQNAGDKYQTERFFKAIENRAYLESAELYFKDKAQLAYGDQNEADISDIVDRLQNELASLSAELEKVEPAWNAYSSALAEHARLLGDNANDRMATIARSLEFCSETIGVLKQAKRGWSKYLANEPVWYALFSWLAPIRKKREHLASIFVEENFGSFYTANSPLDLDSVETELSSLLAKEKQQELTLRNTQETCQTAIIQLARRSSAWVSRCNSLGLTCQNPVELDELDNHLDSTVRFQIFRLTVHYWEGRWLVDVREHLNEVEDHKKNGLKVTQRRWKRRMMITPCIVSTLYMLPFQLKGSRWDDGDFADEYNYNFIDLLLIDEGGLIPPELAGASLSLAKRAVVIGDTRQIEPIQSVSPQVDVGNLSHAGLFPRQYTPDQYKRVKDMGKTVSHGSVMKAAQMLSPYHYDLEMERGMYLYEHRRCYDDIINYSNELCYHNKLKKKRGPAPDNAILPAIGHLHIDGLCQRATGGSRYNELEAQTIAEWLADHRQQLESSYGERLSDIVCVITPFGSQSRTISQACQRKGIKVGKGKGEMTVGTVHAIQGAERPIVIFSSVYTKHNDGAFIDKSPSMLNVSVSRAKDHFLVFGDMDIFTMLQGQSSPRGLLADYLFRSSSNTLEYRVLPRKDLAKSQPVTSLYNAEEHDRFLLEAIGRALDEVHIVTPWVRRDYLEKSAIVERMVDAYKREVTVNVYTDLDLNTQANTYEEKKIKRQELFALSEWLETQGIQLHLVKRVHSKIIMIDSNLLCVGSFNWFSASREGPYVRHETSLVYENTRLKTEIDVIKKSLTERKVKLLAH